VIKYTLEKRSSKYKKRLDQQKKDVQTIKENSAVVNHVMEQKHTFDWEWVTCLEKETRKIPRKIIEGCYIRANIDKCVNLNKGMGIC
jgi:hypothetical protein